MTKQQILDEIRRTAAANGGVALGQMRFAAEAGIKRHEWFGRFWTRWSDAIREAGLEPNRMSVAVDDELVLEKLVLLTRRLGRVPTQGDLLIAINNDPTFPKEGVFRRLGLKPQRIARVIGYCEANPGHEDVVALWRAIVIAKPLPETAPGDPSPGMVGYVYLLKHGTRKEYKIGRTFNPLRREGEVGIELPEKLKPIHYIETDDPAGVERYWHIRFASKRKEGEWFALTAEDVRAVKRWKRIY